MAKRKPKPLIDDEGEVRELTSEDFKRTVPFSALPLSLQKTLSSRKRGPQKAPTKELISIRLSRDVVERLRASGHGWQGRIDTVLRKWLTAETRRKRA
jgi:uncharacterized protein (DUF4415 family)